MSTDLKLYQILEKWNVDPKIGVEIQDWIEDTFEKKQATSIFQYHETKQLPMQTDLKSDMDSLRSESDYKFEKLLFEMRAGFETIQRQMQADRQVSEARFDAIDHRFESMESKFEARFDAMDKRFEAMDTKFEGKFDSIDSRFQSIDHRFQSIDSRFESLEKRLDSTNFYLRLIGVPIIGATLSGVGVTFLYIWERLHKTIGY